MSLRVLLHSPYRETVLHMHDIRKQKREQAQARAQAQQPPCSAPVLWLGDSILHDLVGTGELGWRYVSARFPSTNLGICGETAELCRQRVVGVLEGSATRSGHASPRAVVLMTGTNNLANDTAADVVSKVLSVVSELGERHAHLDVAARPAVLVLGLFAGRGCKKARRSIVSEVNAQLRAAAADGRGWLHFLDTEAALRSIEPCAAAAACAPGGPRPSSQAARGTDRRGGGAGGGAEAQADPGVPLEAMADPVHLNELGCHRLAMAVDARLVEILGAPSSAQ